ncbi:MAG: CPXCG motif-containing cysteine-rich protein [Planctomycetes bacterium]|nr:CPXCG motif-containing cysteine-rich protein [Planctomycetota bacterium]
MQDDAPYICGNCGEEIVVPIDFSAGPTQQYTEDCPVCCCANLLRIEIGQEGEVSIESALE